MTAACASKNLSSAGSIALSDREQHPTGGFVRQVVRVGQQEFASVRELSRSPFLMNANVEMIAMRRSHRALERTSLCSGARPGDERPPSAGQGAGVPRRVLALAFMNATAKRKEPRMRGPFVRSKGRRSTADAYRLRRGVGRRPSTFTARRRGASSLRPKKVSYGSTLGQRMESVDEGLRRFTPEPIEAKYDVRQ